MIRRPAAPGKSFDAISRSHSSCAGWKTNIVSESMPEVVPRLRVQEVVADKRTGVSEVVVVGDG